MRPRSITHEIAQEGHCLQRLPTEVEDVAPWIPRVSSKDSRIRHVHMQFFPRVDDIASSSVVARTPKRPARTEITLNHQFCARPGAFTSMGSRLNLYCGVEEGERGRVSVSAGARGGMERRIGIRDVSVGARESRRGYPRAIHPRDRRGERSPLRGFSSVGYVEIWAEGHSRSAGCGPSSTTCASSWADPSSSSCAYEGKGKDVRACA